MKSLSLSKPHALVMVGIPGSGKTYFAEKFSETFNAPMVSVETIMPHVHELHDAHEIASKQLDELLKTNQSVILEVASSTRTDRMSLAKKLRAKGYEPLVVWVQTDPETAYQRVARDKSKDDTLFESQVKRFSAPIDTEKPIVISGKHTYASQARVVLKRLSAPRANISTHKSIPVRSRGSITVN